MKSYRVALALVAGATLPFSVHAQAADTVVVKSGALQLHALLWRPHGRGPFPAVLFNHGSYGSADPMQPEEPGALGPVFVKHGYALLFLFRRGVGLSAEEGRAGGDIMAAALAEEGQAGRNRAQLDLLVGEELDEAAAGLAYLRNQPEVDTNRVAVAGHSFGGSLALLLAARDTSVGAAVIFSGAGWSWDRSAELRVKLLAAVRRSAPILFVHAANDYSTAPGQRLARESGRLGRPNQLRIYPPVGQSLREGHNLVYRDVATWEPDVFDFLDAELRR